MGARYAMRAASVNWYCVHEPMPAWLAAGCGSLTRATIHARKDRTTRRTTMVTICQIEDAGEPIRNGENNDYGAFKTLKDKNGIYIFFNRSTKEVLYVGESHTNRLGDRIEQHYTKGDTGGNFYKNYCTKQGVSTRSDRAFERFKSLLRCTSIFVILPDGKGGDEKHRVKAIEIDLIRHLAPKYNLEVRQEGVEGVDVDNDVKMILKKTGLRRRDS